MQIPDSVKKKVFQETAGHPQLAQEVARNLVDIANQKQNPQITHKDLEEALQKIVTDIANGVMNNFLEDFCERDIYHDFSNRAISGFKEVVIGILRNQKDLDTIKIQILLEYKYIEPKGSGYKFRVPLMEKWLRRQLGLYL